jgi:hypothetical protein
MVAERLERVCEEPRPRAHRDKRMGFLAAGSVVEAIAREGSEDNNSPERLLVETRAGTHLDRHEERRERREGGRGGPRAVVPNGTRLL